MGRRAQPWSILQQLESLAASVTRGVSASASAALRWPPDVAVRWRPVLDVRWSSSALRWPDIDFSVIDTFIWPVVMAVETIALGTVICFYLTFCGCNF